MPVQVTHDVPHAHAAHPLVDVLVGLTMVTGRTPAADLAMELAQLAAGDRVADVGCGPGVAARRAAARGATVVGVDPSAGMRWLARTLTRGRPAEHVTFVEGAAEATGLADGSVDVVWALSSAHHWADLDAGLREAARILEPGGRLVVLERVATGRGLHGRHGLTRAQADELAAHLRELPFTDVTVDEHRLGRHDQISIRATRATRATRA